MWLHIASYMNLAVLFDTVKAMHRQNLVDEVIEKSEPFLSRCPYSIALPINI